MRDPRGGRTGGGEPGPLSPPDARGGIASRCATRATRCAGGRTRGALIKSPPVPRYAKRPPSGGPFAYLAERGGFEPPKRGLDAYTLSRRAPSTTRTPLRNLPGRRNGQQGRGF